MGEKYRLRPWWERWPGWWSQQQRVVNRRWGHADGYKVQAETHTIIWTGSVRLKKDGVKRKVPVTIIWGPATPFFPPRIGSPNCTSAIHQLSDGSMCLLPPVDPARGWEGIVDIGYWLDRAEEWMVLFFKEDWSMNPALWQWFRFMLPGYRYRRPVPGVQIVALPAEWQDLPPGVGEVVVRMPKGRAGIGAVARWESSAGTWHEWLPARSLVRGDADEIRGLWARPDGVPEAIGDMGFRDVSLNERFVRTSMEIWSTSATKSIEWATLFSVSRDLGHGEERFWVFHRHAPPRPQPGADPFLQMLSLMGLTVQEGVGIPLDRPTLDARREAGRRPEMNIALQTTQVILVGLGSLGSEIAHLLAQEGIRSFYLVDGDAMLPGNEARHRAGLVHAGRPKVEVMEELIRAIQPEAKVLSHVGWLDDLVPQLVGGKDDGATVFVGASGDEATEHFLSDVARAFGDAAIHAWLELDGTVVRVARHIPGCDPTLSAASTMDETPRLIAPPDPAAPRICAETVLPGSALNLHAAANFVVRIVMDVIAGKRDGPNHWLFAPGGTDAPDAPEALKRPYGVVGVTLPV